MHGRYSAAIIALLTALFLGDVTFGEEPSARAGTLPLWHKDKMPWIAEAKEFYVAPDGKADNAGTKESPWDLGSALDARQAIPPGSIVWVRGGKYGTGGRFTYATSIKGTEQKPIIFRVCPGERATIDGGIGGEEMAGGRQVGSGAWFWLWGLEICNSDPNRNLSRARKHRGVDVSARGLRCVNLIIHDTSGATSNWHHIGDGGGLFGCIFWGNGVYDPTTGGSARGGGTYAQNKDGTRYFLDNVSFRNFNNGLDAHASKNWVCGFHVEGNVIFDNGEWGLSFNTNDPEFPMQRNKFISNYTYYKRGETWGKSQLFIGYNAYVKNEDVEVRDNYLVLGPQDRSLYILSVKDVKLTGNTVIGPDLLARIRQQTGGKVTIAKNTWHGGSATPFRYQTGVFDQWVKGVKPPEDKAVDIAAWKAATGETDSTYTKEYPKETKIFVRPNPLEPGRGHVIVYNWAVQKAVQADISGLLPIGASYEIRDAQNYYGKPIAAGVYNGKPVSIPMDQKEFALPIGDTPTIQKSFRPTAPEFGVFVVVAQAAR